MLTYKYPFSNAADSLVRSVWNKGTPIPDYDSRVWRRDICDRAIKFEDHGNTNSKFGWEIDHIKPTAHGGSDDLANLQPLHWENNRRKGDTYPWYCEKAA